MRDKWKTYGERMFCTGLCWSSTFSTVLLARGMLWGEVAGDPSAQARRLWVLECVPTVSSKVEVVAHRCFDPKANRRAASRRSCSAFPSCPSSPSARLRVERERERVEEMSSSSWVGINASEKLGDVRGVGLLGARHEHALDHLEAIDDVVDGGTHVGVAEQDELQQIQQHRVVVDHGLLLGIDELLTGRRDSNEESHPIVVVEQELACPNRVCKCMSCSRYYLEVRRVVPVINSKSRQPRDQMSDALLAPTFLRRS